MAISTRVTRLSEMRGRNNSIGFIRLVAALLVIVGHSFPYGGYGVDPLITLTNNQVAIGRFPVDVFFALSGYLIAMSYYNSGSWGVFTWHRFLRIYPAFIVVIAITAFVLAPIFGDGIDLWYFVRNAPIVLGVTDSIPGMFTDNPGHGSVNSSLWTLPWEVRAYLIVLLLGITGLLRRVWVVGPLFAASWAVFVWQIYSNPGIETGPAVTSGFRLITFFLAGTLFYLLRDRIRIDKWLFLGSLALLVGGAGVGYFAVPYSGGLFYTLAPIPLTYVVFWLAVRLPFRRINTDYDFSYGIYIYGTLVLNIVASFKLGVGWLPYFALCTAVTMVAAAISWYVIEKPSLSLKDLRVRWKPRVVLYRSDKRIVPAAAVGSGSAADR